jgi:hypothetical protein
MGGRMTGVIVAGMHRSGTSLTMRLLESGGWHPGEVVLTNGLEEYLEDAAFVALHRAWLSDCLPLADHETPPDSHPDWGVHHDRVIATGPSSASEATARLASAQQFARTRDAVRDRWAAKDPRATLFLDTWAGLPDLRFVLVYRAPWDVLDSAQRLGHAPFCRRPLLVCSAWLAYNQRLLAFAHAHRARVLVVAGEAVATTPASVWTAVDRFIGMAGTLPDAVIDPDRFVLRDDEGATAAAHRDRYPEHDRVLAVLDQLADVPRPVGP